jgi:hypothetical protein
MTKRQKERLSNLYKLLQTGGIAALQLGGMFLVGAVDFVTGQINGPGVNGMKLAHNVRA